MTGSFAFILYTLYIEAATSDELPQQGIGRHILASDSHKIIQELQKPLGFQIFRAVPVNPKKQRFYVRLQYRQFIDQRGIEHNVRLFLIGEDVALLPSSDRRPHADRPLSGRSPGAGIPDDSSYQAAIRGGNPVVLVYVQLCQGADVYLELVLIRQTLRQFGIQAMDAFYHQHVIFSQFLNVAPIFLMSRHKIKPWDHHFFSCQQFLKLPVK